MAENKKEVCFPANVLGNPICSHMYFLHFSVYIDDLA